MNSKWLVMLFAAFCVSLLHAESPAPLNPGLSLRSPQPAAAPVVAVSGTPAAAGDAAASSDEEYRLGPNDLIELSVFQVKELDRTVRVNTRGMITLPLIGSVQAGGLTGTELEERIAEKLKKDFLQDPQVSVFIKEYTSQRVTVEGQVEKAGIYPMTGRTTLLQAVALAGGLKEMGQEDSIKVFRLDKSGTRQMTVYNLEQVRSGAIADPTVKNNDVIVVEKAQGRAVLKAVTDTLRGFFTLGTL